MKKGYLSIILLAAGAALADGSGVKPSNPPNQDSLQKLLDLANAKLTRAKVQHELDSINAEILKTRLPAEEKGFQFVQVFPKDFSEKMGTSHRNFVYASFIKTLNAKQSAGEFLDASVMQHSMVFSSDPCDCDSGVGFQASLWADIQLNFDVANDSGDSSIVPSNFAMTSLNLGYKSKQGPEVLVGGGLRMFDGIPLGLAHVGVVGVSGPLLTSHVTAGYAWRIRTQDRNRSSMVSKNNIILSWSLFCPLVPYLNAIRLKGDIVVPFSGSVEASHRVAVEVPLGGVLRW